MSLDWERVQELFNEAVDLPAGERDAFLTAACGGDDALRRELDVLIAADAEFARSSSAADGPCGSTATAAAADIATEIGPRRAHIDSGRLRYCPRCSGRFATSELICPIDGETLVEDPEALVDTTIDGLYHVVRLIGRGGFGVVYLARHALLRDYVAIKVLPRQLSADPERVTRFLREGRAARAIRHPNLVTVYDLRATADGLTYMVQEFIDGHTLRDEVQVRGTMTATDALAILAPVADALDEAHAHGIVHRDLKPDNIMLGANGARRTVKLLDLGIAKLHELLTEPATGGNVTHEGHFIGTPAYMSPEQWGTPPDDGGPDIDGRADVYSLAVVIFELLCGRQPYRGRSVSEVRRAHLMDAPPLVSALEPRVPEAFARVLAQAMAKSRGERPPTAGALLAGLRAAGAGTESGAVTTGPEDSAVTGLHGSQVSAAGTAAAGVRTPVVGRDTADPETGGEPVSTRVARPRARMLATAAVAVLALAGGSLAVRQFGSGTAPPAGQPSVAAELITNSGNAVDAAIAPDGQRVAAILRVGSQYVLHLIHVPTRATMALGEPTDSRLYGPTFSPDGNYVYFVEEPPLAGASTLNRISVGGGSPQRVLSGIESAVTFAPAGDRLAYVREGDEPGVRELAVAAVDGSGIRTLATSAGTRIFAPEGPSWAPDGAAIACSVMDTSDGFHGFVARVSVADGTVAPLTEKQWFYVGRVQYSGDGSVIVASAARDPLGVLQLWSVDARDGRASMLRPDLNSTDGISLSGAATGVTVRTSVPSSVWTTGLSAGSAVRKLPLPTTRYYGISLTPDGRLLFSAATNGNPDVWTSSIDGDGARQLTFDEATERDPVMSPDGAFVYYASNRAGPFNIWRTNADGSDPVRLTTGSDDEFPSCTPDGRWIVYQGFDQRSPAVFRVPATGGTPERIGPPIANWPVVSPDGDRVACGTLDPATAGWTVTVFQISGRGAQTSLAIGRLQMPRLSWQRLRWSPDGTALFYLAETQGVAQIGQMPIAGGAASVLTDFPSETILGFDVRGSSAVCIRAPVTSDVVILRGLLGPTPQPPGPS